MVMQQF